MLRATDAAKQRTDGQSRALVGRVAASELFQKAPRLREFLLYAAESTLENRLQDVREQVIAERVFGRKPEFQGAQDSIVRAEARNLRKRLEFYFEGEGKDEPIVILMPKGGYSVVFEAREPVEVPGPQSKSYKIQHLTWVLLIIAGMASALAAHWHAAEASLRNQLRIEPQTLPFSGLFGGEQDTFIVTSDTNLLQVAYVAGRRVTLDEYITRNYPDMPQVAPPGLLQGWKLYEFTDAHETKIAGMMLRANAQFVQHIALRSGHQVQLQDFKEHDSILIGSSVSNPWTEIFEDKVNFSCDLNHDGRIVFRDKAHQSHEYPNASDVQHGHTYARIAFLPRTSGTPSALLIAGTTAQSTQAAGELLVDRERMTNVMRAIGLNPSGPPHYFEVLIRSNNFAGGAILPELVTWRLKPPPEQ